MKKIILWFLIAALVVSLVVFLFGDSLAFFLWMRFGNDDLAMVFIRHDASLAIRIGNYFFNGGAYDLERAELFYQKAISIDPKILWGHYQIARLYFVKGDFNQALEEAVKELEANPLNLRILYIRGLIYGYRGDFNHAENDFRRFIQWAPKEWAGYNDLAWILSKNQKYKEAKEVIAIAFKEVLEADKNPWLWNSLGVAELNLGEYGKAKNSFSNAREFAVKLSEKEWRKAYPGNRPDQAEFGLKTFRAAIEENLSRLQSVNKLK